MGPSRRVTSVLGVAAAVTLSVVVLPEVASGLGSDPAPPSPDSADVAYAQLGLMELRGYEQEMLADPPGATTACAEARRRLPALRESILSFPDAVAREHLEVTLQRFDAALGDCAADRGTALRTNLRSMHRASLEAGTAVSRASDR
jgi:hypothetical protein